MQMEGEGEITLEELVRRLSEAGYQQFAVNGMGLYPDPATKTVYVTDGDVKETAKDTLIDLSDGKTVTVADGLLTAVFSMEDFPEREEDEITAQDVAERFAKVNPQYRGCGISYAEEAGICYPVFPTVEYGKLPVPVTILWNGQLQEYTDKEVEGQIKLTGHVFGKLPGSVVIKYARTHQKDVFAVCVISKDAYQSAETSSSEKKKEKKAEVRYKLPLNLYIVTFNCSYDLKPEHFGGKERVTLEEIKAYMSDKQKMFSDKSRKLDTLYNEELNRLAVMFISGTKGCEMLRSVEEIKGCLSKEQYHGFYVGKEGNFVIHAYPHGNFITRMGMGRECYDPKELLFVRKLPKIPVKMLEEIIEYFREDLDREAAVRIVYRKKEKQFQFYKAGGQRKKMYMYYEYEVTEEMFSPEVIHVMELHSHNTMPAFFSVVDDQDEKDYPGLFGVIGNLDAINPSLQFRAGNNGIFCRVAVEELFAI